MNTNSNSLYKKYLNYESETSRAPYQPELGFYDAIRNGDIKKVQLHCSEPFAEKTGLGILSYNALQNIKYHFAITVALITRYCIDGGMDFSIAYSISDYYILSADQARTLDEISRLHRVMCMDYAKKMQDISKHNMYSKHISDCIDYINDNLNTRITVSSLAAYINISSSYLSRLFKQEVSMSVSEYIQHKKLEVAKNMLQYSEYSISEISTYLAYPSHSYFTEVFRKSTKMTPMSYRTAHYQKFVPGSD